MLTQERLKELLHYSPETGLFTRIIKSAKKVNIGDIVGYLDKSHGYITISIDYTNYYAHRLAFLYMTGKFPKDQVDHIDGIKHHNKWLNLRDANNSENQQNQKKAFKNNKSTGVLGVYSSGENFITKIGINGKQKYLGTFKTIEEAHSAYIEAKRRLHEFGTL